jgi:hypothetical protein
MAKFEPGSIRQISRYDRLWPKIIKAVMPAMPNSIRTCGPIRNLLKPEIPVRVN